MKEIETLGIVLYNRDYKEKDKLVKIFTANAGKQMIFVKGGNGARFQSKDMIQPMAVSQFVLNLNSQGLSFIRTHSDTKFFRQIQSDIFLTGYVTYMLNLVDMAIEDRLCDQALFSFLLESIRLIEAGMDAEVVTFIFEIQILSRFGIHLDFEHCQICGKIAQPFDFSWALQGVVCQKHQEQGLNLANEDPNILYFLGLFAKVDLALLNEIKIKPEMKKKIRIFIDLIYGEYVGLSLKSKKFIDHMNDWLS
ncbi:MULTISPECIES: DNA repair protein RecO [unclassified Enterococcus]|uniref:DNA repair protein RecO n=1 Tax=unclassified Enterococcus TaxID=2608891 RepID=UPI001551DCA2|nr:DNA repair protein RecO [Enterococcus sp. MMGLQ5-2]MBS7584923.1 DNA repair protein RecO [Enterococcus sp. MMGLQ5-1]NPD12778.1 DNA repair protein RecO [Enterococcus sp. MMGLQ5-1]NPD37411.1 DNA repair protein RecO [Enterococcus sp. MMGLQ5-2]